MSETARNRFAPFVILAACLVPVLSTAQDVDVDTERPSFYAKEARLRELVIEVLERHPSLIEARARYRAARERVPQVESLPDPVLGFNQAIRSVETRVGPQYNSVVLSQMLPWFGKLDLRGQVAFQEATSLFQRFRAQQREVIARVKQAFYELAYLDTAIRITEEEQSLFEHYERLAQARYASGQGLQQGVIKIQAEITRVMSRVDLLRQQRVSLAANLNTLRDRPPQDPVPIIETPIPPRVRLDLETLYALGERNRQELKAAEAVIERSEKSLDLAKKNAWPDFTVAAGFINVGRRNDPAGIAQPPPDNGKNAFSLSVGVNIPLWGDKYDAGVREAAESLVVSRSTYANAVNEMEFSFPLFERSWFRPRPAKTSLSDTSPTCRSRRAPLRSRARTLDPTHGSTWTSPVST